MSRHRFARIITYSALGGATALTFLLPDYLTVPVMMATSPPPPEQIVLTGLARDFLASHVDFNVSPPDGLGHYAGNVSQLLGPDGRPLQVHGVTDFTVSFGSLVPGVPYAARATVLGAEITSAGNPIPVTIQAETDTQVFEPYGSYSDPGGSGNVNDGANPRHYIFSLNEVYTAETPISITATSWLEGAAGNSTFGETTVLSDTRNDAGHTLVATKVTLPSAGTITSISAYLSTSDTEDPWMRYAIYSDNSGEPGTLLAQTAEFLQGGSTTWYDRAVPSTPLAAGTYWLALSGHDSDQRYRRSNTGSVIRMKSGTHGHDGYPSSWGSSSSSSAGSISIKASYTPDVAMFTPHMTVRSGDNSPYVKVLKDGDPVPNIPAFQDQAGLADFVDPYVDVASGLVTLQDNQAIYLFELGTTNLSSPSADFQDLVIMVTLATDPAYFVSPDTVSEGSNPIGFKVDSQWTDSAGRNIAPHLYKPSLGDSAGVSGITSSGGVSSPASFYGWFRDVLGTNQSVTHDIVLTNDGFGVYEFTTTEFHPLDGRLYGNEGRAHNDNFTYSMQAGFTYDASANQFFEFQGGDGAFLFINGKLAIDLGGVQTGSLQRADVNRLGLTDGQPYDIQLFYANRHPGSSTFSFRTNVTLSGGEVMGSVTAAFD